MHLLGPSFTSNATKKRKSKGITIDGKVAADLKAHNKQMKRLGLREKSVAEYIAYRQGNYNPPKKQVKDTYTKSPLRESPAIPSYGDQVGNGAAKPANEYTGTLIKGIATMHKSNAVPIINEDQAKEISQMRRN